MSSGWKCYAIENFQNDDSVEGVLNNGYDDDDYQLDAILNSEIDKALGPSGELNYPYLENFENTRIDSKDKCKAINDRNTWCENTFLNRKHNKQGCFAPCNDPRFPMARGKCNDYGRDGLQCGTRDKSIDIELNRNKKFFTKRKRVPGSIGVDK